MHWLVALGRDAKWWAVSKTWVPLNVLLQTITSIYR